MDLIGEPVGKNFTGKLHALHRQNKAGSKNI